MHLLTEVVLFLFAGVTRYGIIVTMRHLVDGQMLRLKDFHLKLRLGKILELDYI